MKLLRTIMAAVARQSVKRIGVTPSTQPPTITIGSFVPEDGFCCPHCGTFDESAYRQYIRAAIRLRTGEPIIC